MVSQGKGLRRGRRLPLTKKGASGFFIRAVAQRFGPFVLEARGNEKEVVLFLQGSRVRTRKELREFVPIVVDSPHGSDLVQGADAERRRWLDALLAVCMPSFFEARARYLRALLQRARALRAGKREEAQAWGDVLLEEGERWHTGRRLLVERINAALREEEDWAGSVRLYGDEREERAFRREMRRALSQDATLLCYGPHLEGVRVKRNDVDARIAASRGEQRLCAIALRLAESRLLMDARAVVPVLLLDDATEALDSKRRDALVERLLRYPGQVLATAQAVPSPKVPVQEVERE